MWLNKSHELVNYTIVLFDNVDYNVGHTLCDRGKLNLKVFFKITCYKKIYHIY